MCRGREKYEQVTSFATGHDTSPSVPIRGGLFARIYINLITTLYPPASRAALYSFSEFSSHFYSHSNSLSPCSAALSPSLHPYHYSAQWCRWRRNRGKTIINERTAAAAVNIPRERETGRERRSKSRLRSLLPSVLPSFHVIYDPSPRRPRKKAVRVRPPTSVRLSGSRAADLRRRRQHRHFVIHILIRPV